MKKQNSEVGLRIQNPKNGWSKPDFVFRVSDQLFFFCLKKKFTCRDLFFCHFPNNNGKTFSLKLGIHDSAVYLSVCLFQSRLELITPEGLRVDGRRANELRKITAKTSVFSQADGSAYIEQGNTKCLAAVYGPREVIYFCTCMTGILINIAQVRHRMQALADRALINVEFNVAPFSSSERKKRSKNDK